MATKKSTTAKKASGKPEMEGNAALKLEPAPDKVYSITDAAYIENLLLNAPTINGVKRCCVPIDLLDVDSYQRTRKRKVSWLIANWDDVAADELIVNYRDGHLWVVDGQQRTFAAKARGIKSLPCRITMNEDRLSEIRRYVRQGNGRVKVDCYDLFHARCMDPDDHVAVQLKNLMDKYHIVYTNSKADETQHDRIISRKPSASEIGRIGSLSEAIKIAEVHGIEMCEEVFETIDQLGWHPLKNAYSSRVLRTLTALHKTHGALRARSTLVQVLNNHTPDEVFIKARNKFPEAGPTEAMISYLDRYM